MKYSISLIGHDQKFLKNDVLEDGTPCIVWRNVTDILVYVFRDKDGKEITSTTRTIPHGSKPPTAKKIFQEAKSELINKLALLEASA
jgi:hypothetical protein